MRSRIVPFVGDLFPTDGLAATPGYAGRRARQRRGIEVPDRRAHISSPGRDYPGEYWIPFNAMLGNFIESGMLGWQGFIG